MFSEIHTLYLYVILSDTTLYRIILIIINVVYMVINYNSYVCEWAGLWMCIVYYVCCDSTQPY